MGPGTPPPRWVVAPPGVLGLDQPQRLVSLRDIEEREFATAAPLRPPTQRGREGVRRGAATAWYGQQHAVSHVTDAAVFDRQSPGTKRKGPPPSSPPDGGGMLPSGYPVTEASPSPPHSVPPGLSADATTGDTSSASKRHDESEQPQAHSLASLITRDKANVRRIIAEHRKLLTRNSSTDQASWNILGQVGLCLYG